MSRLRRQRKSERNAAAPAADRIVIKMTDGTPMGARVRGRIPTPSRSRPSRFVEEAMLRQSQDRLAAQR